MPGKTSVRRRREHTDSNTPVPRDDENDSKQSHRQLSNRPAQSRTIRSNGRPQNALASAQHAGCKVRLTEEHKMTISTRFSRYLRWLQQQAVEVLQTGHNGCHDAVDTVVWNTGVVVCDLFAHAFLSATRAGNVLFPFVRTAMLRE